MNKLTNFIVISLFSLFMVLYSALLQAKPGEAIQWHLDAPFWMALQCFIAQWLTLRWFEYFQLRQSQLPDTKRYIRVFIGSNVSFTVVVTVFILMIEYAIGIQAITVSHIILLISMQFILHTIVGGFTLLFKVFEHIKRQRITLDETEKNLLESQVKTLQQHIDPHFLFNNLNVLSALILQDPDEADEYLNTFCDIYRYILQHKDHSLVPLKNELAFARSYMDLICTRFENAYILEVDVVSDADFSSYVLPCSLQLAIENVIKHNQGDKDNPLVIKITIELDRVRIFNRIIEKRFKRESSQLGITNLRARCTTIFNVPLELTHTKEYFELIMPLCKRRRAA